MTQWYRRNPDGSLSISIHAQPGAKRTEVCGLHGEALKIRVAAPALEDRANDALVEFIAEQLGVPKRAVTIASGGKSREKRIEIRASASDPEQLLNRIR
jgi:uncharacterized protein (TIGR00251 family)